LTAKIVEVEQDLLFCAPLTALVKDFEVREDFRSDRILRRESPIFIARQIDRI
jgi:hypothetical protein